VPTRTDLTPERLATIRRLAEEDPYFKGVLAALTEPSPVAGVSSSQRKDTP